MFVHIAIDFRKYALLFSIIEDFLRRTRPSSVVIIAETLIVELSVTIVRPQCCALFRTLHIFRGVFKPFSAFCMSDDKLLQNYCELKEKETCANIHFSSLFSRIFIFTQHKLPSPSTLLGFTSATKTSLSSSTLIYTTL